MTEMGFYYQKVADSSVEVVLTRCAKLYTCVENLFTVFRLLRKTETENHKERLVCAIRGFLADIILHPESFWFKGQDILSQM